MPTLVEAELTEEERDFADLLEDQRKAEEEQAERTVLTPAEFVRGATEGPLKYLIPVYVDVETMVNSEVSLSKQTLRQYARDSYLEAMAIAIGDDPVQVFFTDKLPGLTEGCPMLDDRMAGVLRTLAQDPKYVFIAHNAAFDMRILRFMLDVPHPVNVWCTLEGAMGAWPELPGGYSLDNCSRRLGLDHSLRKFKFDLKELNRVRTKILKTGKPFPTDDLTDEIKAEFRRVLRSKKIKLPKTLDLAMCNKLLEIYNARDVECMREIYLREAARIPALEQECALRTHKQRKFHFQVDPERLEKLIYDMDVNAKYAEQQAMEYVTDEQAANIFNRETDDGSLRSIRYQRLRNVINELKTDGEGDFDSTSLKKLSPIKLARNPTVASILEQTSRAGKMVSHKRRAMIFSGVAEVDCELGYMRAHTGRFSSPSVGKGLNLHNIPKHDKAVAEPIRRTFRLPPEYCLVRADLANVEYRIEGYLTECLTVIKMFDEGQGGSIFTDPYCAAWERMTGVKISKKDAIRQVAKSAVLGLGFCMSPIGYAKVLLGVLANKKSGITEESLQEIILANGWKTPPGKVKKRIRDILGCSDIVACAAYHIHRVFNEAHPEFSRTADWLVRTVQAVGACGPKNHDDARRALDKMYMSTKAPDRNLIGLEIDDDPIPERPCVRVRCGPWPATVCWREPCGRPVDFHGNQSTRLTILKANGYPKTFTRQLAIENVTQAAARNAMCMGVADLDKMGFPHCIHVHDEAMLIVPRKREAVLAAREALLGVFGPNHGLPYGWSILVKPEEITCTQSMYEDELDVAKPFFSDKENKMIGGDRWGRIERNEPGCLEDLP